MIFEVEDVIRGWWIQSPNHFSNNSYSSWQMAAQRSTTAELTADYMNSMVLAMNASFRRKKKLPHIYTIDRC